MTHCGKVVPEFSALPKHRFSALLSAGWARTIANLGDGGKQVMADKLDAHPKTIENALSGRTVPEAHTIFNSVLVDPTALTEIFNALGFQLVPVDAIRCDDLTLATGLTDVTGDLIRSRGKRSPRATVELADKLRPIIAEEEAIVAEADRMRGLN